MTNDISVFNRIHFDLLSIKMEVRLAELKNDEQWQQDSGNVVSIH